MAQLQPIQTDQAPAAIGPYSQAIVANGLVYTAGQIALDPTSGDLVQGGIQEQTERVMRNLTAILEAAGASLQTVIKTTVFLKDMGEFAPMNEIYGRHFGDHRPARSTVAVAGLPRNVDVEIEAVAALRANS